MQAKHWNTYTLSGLDVYIIYLRVCVCVRTYMYILSDDMFILFYLLNAFFILFFIEPCMNLVDKTQI